MKKQILTFLTVSTIVFALGFLTFTLSTQTVLKSNASESNLLVHHAGNSPQNGGSDEHAHGVGGGGDRG